MLRNVEENTTKTIPHGTYSETITTDWYYTVDPFYVDHLYMDTKDQLDYQLRFSKESMAILVPDW
jgi:hypothetical protein